jgi:multidrug efflux pump subunit AcrB
VGVSFIDFQRVRLGSQYIQLIVDLKKRRPQGVIERFIAPVVSLRFTWEGTRERSADEIIDELRGRLQRLPGIHRMSVLRPQGGPAGADIEIGVVGDDVNTLRRLAEGIRDYVARLPGCSDVRQDMDPGKLEYRYELNERGRQLGLTQAQLAAAVRTGFLGQEVVHVNWRDERIPVRLIYPDKLRHSAQALERLPITLANGTTVFLQDVANLVRERGFNTINRRDMRRLATLTAEVDPGVTTPDEVIALVKQEFAALPRTYPGYELLFLGEKKEAAESIGSMKRAMVIALGVIFFILAALFRSLLDPLVVMFAIPFGAIGVIIGHAIFGYHIQFLSLIGFLALTGIVVNDSLILVDFAKKLRNQGRHRLEALVEAGRVRIRPILLTSITTFLGISPLIFFATGQTAFLSPMAVSLGFGLLFSTLLILLVLPCFYLIADDLRRWAGRWARRLFGMGEVPDRAPATRNAPKHEADL